MSEVSFRGAVILRRIGGLLPGGRLLRLSVALLVLFAALAAATANATFTAPFVLSASGKDSQEPQVAIDANGNGIFTWTLFDGQADRVQARTRSSSGTNSAVLKLSPAGVEAFSPQVAVNGAGAGIVVWTQFDGTSDRILARKVSSAGVLGASVLTLSDAGQNAESPQVGIDSNGNALAVWERSDATNTRVQARPISSSGVLGSVQTLSASGQNAFSPQVAVNGTGAGLVDWTRFDGTIDRIQARVVSSAGVLGSGVLKLSDLGQNAEEPQVGIDANGNGLAVWRRSDGLADRVQARPVSPTGVLGTVQTLSGELLNAFSPQVAVNGSGAGLVDWVRTDGQNDRIELRSVSTAGVLGASVLTLSASGQNGEEPQIGIDANGNGVATWERFDGLVDRIQARTVSSAGVLGTVQKLSAVGVESFSSQVAVNGAGAALADWISNDQGPNERINAAAGP